MNSAYFLEILNGGAVTPELIWVVILGTYLARESERRGLHYLDWFNLPPSMNLILAIFIFDFAILLRSETIWFWRRFNHAGQFGPMQSGILVFSGTLIVLGSLCKIRAMTHPDWGNGPWLVAAVITLMAVIGLVIF